MSNAIKKKLDITKRVSPDPLLKIRLPGKLIRTRTKGSPYPVKIILLIIELHKLNKEN